MSRPRVGRDHLAFPAPTSGIQRVDMMKILGVTLTYTLSFNTHIDIVLRQAAQSLYALRVLRSHGLTGEALWDVTRATTLSKMLHASPAWWGYVDMGYRQRLQNFIFKLQRLGFLPNNTPSFEEMCGSADDVLFGSMLTNEYHVLAQLLPPVKETPYHLRPRAHNRSLPATDNIMRITLNYSSNRKIVYTKNQTNSNSLQIRYQFEFRNLNCALLFPRMLCGTIVHTS